MTIEKKKVLFALSSLDIGGSETYLLRFLHFADDQLNATVLCKSGRDGELRPQFEGLGVNIVNLKLGKMSIRDQISLYKFLKKEQYHSICDLTGDFSSLTLLTARIASIPTRIAFYRNSSYQFRVSAAVKLYMKFSNYITRLCATKILANSNHAINVFYPHGLPASKYSIVRNGIPTPTTINQNGRLEIRKKMGIPDDAFLIGHLGRATAAKNHQQIFKVAHNLIRSNCNIYFILCGKEVLDKFGPDPALHHPNIILRNSIKNPWEIMQSLDAFYFPSTSEGSPNALLEAFAVGLPFVASNIPPIEEITPDDYKKFLVPPNDISTTIKLLTFFSKKPINHRFPIEELKQHIARNNHPKTSFDNFLLEV